MDNCGSPRNQVCGVCPLDDLCTAQHQCCTPETNQQLCNAAGAQCGSITVMDACVQTRTVDCGGCNGGRACQGNLCAPLGWVFVGVGNSTYAGTNNGATIGTVPSTAQHIAIAVWAAEDENRTLSGNGGNYAVMFDGVMACTRSVAPWTATTPEGGCFIEPAGMSFHFDGNYPVGSITECALDFSATTNVVSFEDQSATEDCGFAIYAYVP